MNILFISKFPTLLGLTPCKCQKVCIHRERIEGSCSQIKTFTIKMNIWKPHPHLFIYIETAAALGYFIIRIEAVY